MLYIGCFSGSFQVPYLKIVQPNAFPQTINIESFIEIVGNQKTENKFLTPQMDMLWPFTILTSSWWGNQVKFFFNSYSLFWVLFLSIYFIKTHVIWNRILKHVGLHIKCNMLLKNKLHSWGLCENYFLRMCWNTHKVEWYNWQNKQRINFHTDLQVNFITTT